jgi:hypothetical protein
VEHQFDIVTSIQLCALDEGEEEAAVAAIGDEANVGGVEVPGKPVSEAA